MKNSLNFFLLVFILSIWACATNILPLNAQNSIGREEEIINFDVRIAVDQHYRAKNQNLDRIKNDSWRRDASDLIDKLNAFLKNQNIKVKFRITDIIEWDTKDETNILLTALSDLIREVAQGNNDLVIGLTAKDAFKEEKVAGGYYSARGYILIIDYSLFDFSNRRDNKNSWTLLLLAHEIGHYFLLGHSTDPKSIMHHIWVDNTGRNVFLKEEVDYINEIAILKKKKFIPLLLLK